MLKTVLIILLIVLLLLTVALFVLGFISSKGDAPGLDNGQLTRCPESPNCICTEYPDDAGHAAAPIALRADISLSNIAGAVTATGGEVLHQTENYIAARYVSGFFRFVDDVELRLDTQTRKLHVRSASRVGKSDLGANGKRIEALRNALQK